MRRLSKRQSRCCCCYCVWMVAAAAAAAAAVSVLPKASAWVAAPTSASNNSKRQFQSGGIGLRRPTNNKLYPQSFEQPSFPRLFPLFSSTEKKSLKVNGSHRQNEERADATSKKRFKIVGIDHDEKSKTGNVPNNNNNNNNNRQNQQQNHNNKQQNNINSHMQQDHINNSQQQQNPLPNGGFCIPEESQQQPVLQGGFRVLPEKDQQQQQQQQVRELVNGGFVDLHDDRCFVMTHTCAIDLDNIYEPYVSRSDSESVFVEYLDNGNVIVPAGPVGQIKETLARFLATPVVELVVCGLVLASCMLVAISTLPNMEYYLSDLYTITNMLGAVFCVEFLARWFSSNAPTGRHILNPQFAIDVMVVVLPFLFAVIPISFWVGIYWIPDWIVSPSALINLKLLRVLRLRNILRDKTSYAKFEVAMGWSSKTDFTRVKDWQLQLARVLLSLFTLLSVASGMIYTAEHDVNPQFPDYFTAFYFGLVTLTTVGFGDIVPITAVGKAVVSGSILLGVAVIPAQTAALIEALLARQALKRSTDPPATTNAITQSPPPSSLNAPASTTTSSLITDASASTLLQNEILIPTQQQQQQHLYNDDDLEKVTSRFNRNADINGSSNRDRISLEMNAQCSTCGAKMHWTNARYCWSCGVKLKN